MFNISFFLRLTLVVQNIIIIIKPHTKHTHTQYSETKKTNNTKESKVVEESVQDQNHNSDKGSSFAISSR